MIYDVSVNNDFCLNNSENLLVKTTLFFFSFKYYSVPFCYKIILYT